MEELYREHSEWLRRLLAWRLHVRAADVEDILQDTWIRASGQSAAIEHPRAFLSQIALNLFRDRRRRDTSREVHRRRVVASDRSAGAAPPGLSEQEAAFELERVVVGLPETYRDAFVLSRFSNMTNAEIASHLGLSVKTVEWRIGKALELCVIRLRS